MKHDYPRIEHAVSYVLDNTTEGDVEEVLKAIEKFNETEMILKIGENKGKKVLDLIDQHQPKVLVQLGGHFGYRVLKYANQIKDDFDAHFYVIESDSLMACVVEKIARHAGLGDKITVIKGSFLKAIPILKTRYDVKNIDFMSMNHLHSAKISDFQLAASNHLLTKGSLIVAHNVISTDTTDFLEFMNLHPSYKDEIHGFTTVTPDNDKFKDATLVAIHI